MRGEEAVVRMDRDMFFFFAESFKGVACEDFESIVVEEGGAEIGEAAGGVEAMPGDIGKCVEIGV